MSDAWTFDTEETLDRWIGVLPNGNEYYGAGSLEELFERERDHRLGLAEVATWIEESGGHYTSIPVPDPFTEVIHRIIHTKTTTTTTTTETRQVRPEETP